MDDTIFMLQDPSFLDGIARSMDLFADLTRYNISPSGVEADKKALFHDWLAVFKDLQTAFQEKMKLFPENRKITDVGENDSS